MPAHHIKRIMDTEKKMYSTLGIPFTNEDDVQAILPQLRFKKPSDPYAFWGNIHGWQDAVKKALPMKQKGGDKDECYDECKRRFGKGTRYGPCIGDCDQEYD
jgi:hypothetical protein